MYKVSQFNVPFKRGGIYFLYNSHTGAFVKLSEEYRESIRKINQGRFNEVPDKHLDDLKAAGFVVEKSKDEIGLYKYLPESVTEVYQKCWETQSCRDFDSISNVHLLGEEPRVQYFVD
ncbi:hypothetical protein AVP43_02430 [Geobacillus stearothermophilus]|nr:hypothetical protein AVP43_02430 [Geobacillus stearothermophilus]